MTGEGGRLVSDTRMLRLEAPRPPPPINGEGDRPLLLPAPMSGESWGPPLPPPIRGEGCMLEPPAVLPVPPSGEAVRERQSDVATPPAAAPAPTPAAAAPRDDAPPRALPLRPPSDPAVRRSCR